MGSSKKTYVGGSVSRIRPDSLIRNTLPFVVAGAATGNQDISEAIRINAISGTVGSYSSYFRFAKKYLTEPVVKFSYYKPEYNALADTIRLDTGNAFPLTLVPNDIYLNLLSLDNHIKYHLQEDFDYNLTTNILVYSGINYYLKSYKKITGGYEITAYRDKVTTTTVTKAYSVSWDAGLSKWRIKKDTTTDESWEYFPPATTGVDSNVVTTYSDYDDINDPWEFGTMSQGTTYYPCANSTYEYLCDPVITGYFIFEPSAFEMSAFANNSTRVITKEIITFDLLKELPPEIVNEFDTEIQDTVTIPNDYWQIFYEEADRRYIWIGSEIDFPAAMGEEVEVIGADSGFGRFAPIVPFKDNKQFFQEGEERYTKSHKVLKRVNLKLKTLISELSKSSSNGDIADAYVFNGSKLNSNDYDELAYNFAFFTALYNHPFAGYTNTFDPQTDSYPDAFISSMRLHVFYENIFDQVISWSSITITNENGVLTNEYETVLTTQTGVRSRFLFLKINSGTLKYIIRKRTSPTTYQQIHVSNLSITYYVRYGNKSNQRRAYAPDKTKIGDKDSEDQFLIPMNIDIAKASISRHLETFYLRTHYVGVFSYKVVKKKWYQRGVFAVVGFVLAMVFCQACLSAILSMGATVAGVIGITFAGITMATAMAIAFVIGLATFAVINFAVQEIITAIVKNFGMDSFLSKLLMVVVIFVQIHLSGGFGDMWKNIQTTMSTYLEFMKAEIQLASIELQELGLKLEQLQQTIKDMGLDANLFIKKYALEIMNLFKGAGEQHMTEEDLDFQVMKPDFVYGQIKKFIEYQKSLMTPPRLVLESQQLVDDTLLPV